MGYSTEPDFYFLATCIIPEFKAGRDWLSPLLLHAEEINFCPNWQCSTCGATPFKTTMKVVWSNPIDGSLSNEFRRLNFSGLLKPTEVKKILKGLSQIDYIGDKEKSYTFVGDLFEDDIYSNRLRQMIFFIWGVTRHISSRLFGDDYELLNRLWSDTLVGEEYKKMQRHYAAKKVRLATQETTWKLLRNIKQTVERDDY